MFSLSICMFGRKGSLRKRIDPTFGIFLLPLPFFFVCCFFWESRPIVSFLSFFSFLFLFMYSIFFSFFHFFFYLAPHLITGEYHSTFTCSMRFFFFLFFFLGRFSFSLSLFFSVSVVISLPRLLCPSCSIICIFT